MTCSRARWNCSVNIGVLFWALRGAAVEQLFELLLEFGDDRGGHDGCDDGADGVTVLVVALRKVSRR